MAKKSADSEISKTPASKKKPTTSASKTPANKTAVKPSPASAKHAAKGKTSAKKEAHVRVAAITKSTPEKPATKKSAAKQPAAKPAVKKPAAKKQTKTAVIGEKHLQKPTPATVVVTEAFAVDLPPLAFLSGIGVTELHLEKGAVLYSAGEPCTRAYFVKKGGFCAELPGDNGSRIVLYSVGPGEICVLSVAAAIAHGKHRVSAVLTEPSDILAVPADKLAFLLDSDAVARKVVYSEMSQRLTDVLILLEEVAFRRRDIRLAIVLCRKITYDNHLWPGTIAELAVQAETPERVVMLILQEFQRQGLVSVGQGVITVTDRAALIRKSME